MDAVFASEDMQRAVTAGGQWVSHRPFREEAHGRVELWPTVTPIDAASRYFMSSLLPCIFGTAVTGLSREAGERALGEV